MPAPMRCAPWPNACRRSGRKPWPPRGKSEKAYFRADALRALAERLPAEHLPTVLAAAREIQEAYPRARVLAALAERLPAEHLPTALAAAREIQEAYFRADALRALAERLPEVWLEALARRAGNPGC
jgi:hypothetical protein